MLDILFGNAVCFCLFEEIYLWFLNTSWLFVCWQGVMGFSKCNLVFFRSGIVRLRCCSWWFPTFLLFEAFLRQYLIDSDMFMYLFWTKDTRVEFWNLWHKKLQKVRMDPTIRNDPTSSKSWFCKWKDSCNLEVKPPEIPPRIDTQNGYDFSKAEVFPPSPFHPAHRLLGPS